MKGKELTRGPFPEETVTQLGKAVDPVCHGNSIASCVLIW